MKKDDDDDDDENDDSYDQMITHDMKMMNKMYAQLQDLIRIFSSESINIFRDIFDR